MNSGAAAALLLSIQVLGAPAAAAPPDANLAPLLAAGTLQELRWADWGDVRSDLVRLYTGGAPIWSRSGQLTTQARELAALLETADAKGLDPADYDGPRWRERIDGWDGSDDARAARFDVALSVSLLRYASALACGRTRSREFDPPELGVPARDLARVLWQASSAEEPGRLLEELEPAHAGYRALLAALPRYRERATESGAERDAKRVRQIELTLERWRTLARTFPEPPIFVNVPEFKLYAYDASGHQALTTEVVVGDADTHQTPLLADRISAIVFRPSWNVPPRITSREFVPKLRRDPGYLRSRGYQVVTLQGRTAAVDLRHGRGRLLDGLGSGRLALRQKAGPGNLLGRVKFVLPNSHSIYLHDTPSRSLFKRARRDLSHGCVRVRDAEGLARWLLRDSSEWTPDAIRKAMNGTRTVEVPLERPVPVLIVYATAVAGPGGKVEFFEDVYGRDADLERLWTSGYPYQR